MVRRLSDKVARAMVRNQVDALRYAAGLQGEVRKLLAELQASLAAELARVDPTGVTRTAYQQARLRALLEATNAAISGAYGEAARVSHAGIVEVASIHAGKAAYAINANVGADLVRVAFTREQIASIVSDVMIEGAPSKEWWAGQSAALRGEFMREMRMGMARGENLHDLVKRVKALGEASTKRAEALVRTSVISTANAAHLAAYRENADIIKGVQWLSTLDTRTTPTCRALDGKVWDLDFEPVGHSMAFPGATAHWGCRSTQVPITKSWEELAQEAGGDTRMAKALDSMPPATRASMDGQVAGDLRYEDWLKEQDEATQLEVLGPGRLALWKRDQLSLAEMLDQRGNPLTLEELRKGAMGKAVDHAEVLRASMDRYEGELDMVKRMAKNAGSPFTNLTDGQMVALNQYTRGAYVQVNQELWTGEMTIERWTAHTREVYQAISALADDALAQLPKAPGVSWRGEPIVQGWTSRLLPGAEVEVKGFWSSSAEKHQAFEEKVLWMLRGKSGRAIAPLSAYETREAEVLFRPGSRWRILSMEKLKDGRTLIAAEEL